MINSKNKSDLNSEEQGRISPWLMAIFIVALLSNVLGGAISTLMAVYLPEVVQDLVKDGNKNDLGQISAYINAWYLLGWTFGGFIWGILSDSIGRFKSFVTSFLLYGVFTFLISFSVLWEMVVLLRFLTGFCVGGVLVISNTYLSEIWPQRSRAIFIGFLSVGFPIGIVAAGLINYLFYSWRSGFLVGIVPVLIAVITMVFIKNRRAESEENPYRDLSYNFKMVFNDYHKDLIVGSIIFGSMLIGMWAVFSWFPTWIQSILGSGDDGQKQRSISMMLLGLGGISGGFISGWISKGIGLKSTMKVAFTGCFLMALIIFGLNRSFSNIIYVEIALMAIFFGISQGALATYIPQLFESCIRGTATGFCYNIGRLFTTAAVFFVGALVGIFGGYGNSLLVFSGVFLFGLVTTFFTHELKIKT